MKNAPVFHALFLPLVRYARKAAFDRLVAFDQRAVALQIVPLIEGGIRVFLHSFLHETDHHVLLALGISELPVKVGGIGQGLYDIGMDLQDFVLISNQAVICIHKRLQDRGFVQVQRFSVRSVFVFMIAFIVLCPMYK